MEDNQSKSSGPLAAADMLAGTMELDPLGNLPPEKQQGNGPDTSIQVNRSRNDSRGGNNMPLPPPPMDLDGRSSHRKQQQHSNAAPSTKQKELSIITTNNSHASDAARSTKMATSKSASDSVSVLFSSDHHHHHNNKRRHSVAITTAAPQAWDHFVRLGTRTKALVDDVLAEAQEGTKRFKATAATTTTNAATNAPPRQQHQLSFGADLAQEKMLEVKQLQRQLEESKAREAALAATNQELLNEKSSTESRLQQTANALQIAGRNADRARADADAAEVTSATLAQTLQSLQTVVEETKLACAQLLEEQQEVSTMAANTETKLIHKEAEVARLKKEAERLRQANMLLEHTRDDWKQERKTLEQSVKHYQEQYETIKRQKMEQTELEKARKERADKVEADYRRAHTLLEEATAGQQSAKETIEKLQADIITLQTANADVHEKLAEQQTTARTNNEKMSASLTKAEFEAQELRIKNEAAGEEMERMKLDKEALEKNIQQLKTALLQAQRELKDKTAVGEAATATTATATPANQVTPRQNTAPSPMALFSLPVLPRGNTARRGKENVVNKEAVRKGEVCCICLKAISSSMYKSCTCGSCNHKAHPLCVKNIAAPPSLSHPGTPAAPLPTILCKFGIRDL